LLVKEKQRVILHSNLILLPNLFIELPTLYSLVVASYTKQFIMSSGCGYNFTTTMPSITNYTNFITFAG